mmetsp:Transcript_56032/g.137418  ORF Transcript_56032/g.137418 Transcript_56032/m.137418 type:complete len:223 (+) Transcript_56032:88-756(+)
MRGATLLLLLGFAPMVAGWRTGGFSCTAVRLFIQVPAGVLGAQRGPSPRIRRAGAMAYMSSAGQDVFTKGLMFGPHKIDSSQVFYKSRTGKTAAFVNLRPIVPGHVLVAPVRNVLKLHQMSEDEVCDLWLSAREIGGKLEAHYRGEALNYAIQDGAAAGQSVPHVHVHILPRRRDDFERNDDVYEELEHYKAFHVPDEGERRNRSKEEMAEEASELRRLFDP